MSKKLLIIALLLTITNVVFAIVSSSETKRQYFVCNGSATTFTFTMECNSSDDIRVEKRLISTGVPTSLVEDTDYTITNTGSSYLEGGVVTIDPALASTYQVVIIREIVQTQETVAGAINPASVELALDKVTRQAQDVRNDIAQRVLRIPDSDPSTAYAVLANWFARKGLFVAFDSTTGAPTVASAVTGSVTISAFMETVNDDATAILAMATLNGIPVFNVLNPVYGATGDGATDDTTALNTTLTTANAAGAGIVYFPDGTYLISAKLTVGSNITLWFAPGAGLKRDTGMTDECILIDGKSNVTIRGGILDGDDVDGDGINIDGTCTDITIENVEFKNFDGDVVVANDTSVDISRFTFVNNRIHTSWSGVWLNCIVSKVIATGNKIWDLDKAGSVYGLGFGTNSTSDENSNEKYVISNNHIYDLDNSSASGECHAIIVYGREAIITNNTIDDITNSSDGGDAEGIYTKCFLATIANNTLVDAGTGQGSISIKGELRGGAGSSPNGYGVVVTGNTLYSTTGAYDGISISSEDVLCKGNYLEGFGKCAIVVQTVAGDNIAIVNNTIRKHRGVQTILVQVSGNTGYIVKDNLIYDVLASQGTITTTNAIQITLAGSSTTANDIWIDGNYIFENDNSSATTSIRGLLVSIAATNTMNRLTITNNKFYINHSSATEFGIHIVVSGTLTTLYMTGNDCASVPVSSTTYPFFVDTPGNITDFTVENNFFYGPTMALAANTNIEWWHTGTKFTNTGSGATRTHILPAAVIGLRYPFYAVEDQDIRIDPDASEQIRGGSGAGKYISLDTLGDSLVLECFVAGWWEQVAVYGTLATE